MTLYQALLRPVEITSSNNTLAYTRSGGGGTTTLTAGVWANVLAIADAMRDAADFSSVYINSSGKIVLTAGTSITLTHSQGWRVLGFSGNESAGTTVTADYTPLYCWLPTYSHGDMNRFAKPSGEQFFGSRGTDGNLYGIPVEARQRRQFMWTAELAKKVFPSANITSYTDGVNGLTRVDEDRCFWEAVNKARTASITATTSGNVSPKGCYYVDDFSQFTGASPSTTWPEKGAWGDGSTYFDDTTNTSTYVFCSVTEAAPTPDQFRGEHNSHYKPSVTLNTATAGGWESSASFA